MTRARGALTAGLLLTACAHPAMSHGGGGTSPAERIVFFGDSLVHRSNGNGAFRLSYGFEYVYALETSNAVENFKFDR